MLGTSAMKELSHVVVKVYTNDKSLSKFTNSKVICYDLYNVK